MKYVKTKIILFLIVFLILSIFLLQVRNNQNFKCQEELIFFKLFSSKEPEENSNQIYQFQVTYKHIDFKNIHLADTTNQKIAPGTKGNFEILLESNKAINYRIQFKSIYKKPKNLYFQMQGEKKKYENLEDMEETLQGEFTKNKSIKIYWMWDYENNEEQNLQDTKDGQTIRAI